MARRYTKKNAEYWGLTPPSAPQHQAAASEPAISPVPMPEIEYGSYIALGSAVNGGGDQTVIRGRALNSGMPDAGAFSNIKAIPSPYYGYSGTREYLGASEAINLAARAWAGVSVVRNAIEAAVEFSCQSLYLKCKNETVRTFFEEWLRMIQVNSLKEQFFREYYRSGNVFLYRFDGQFGPSYYGHFQRSFGAKSNRVPIRYQLLNPGNMFVPAGVSFPYTYVRLLSTYECERLRTPMTEQDKQMFRDLPETAKKQIQNGTGNPMGIYINMDPTRLRFAFYKKQSYEPLAVPMVWPVLPDIEWKLTLKKMDMALTRTIEHAMLLVTMGEPPSKENGGNGINQNNIARVQGILNNPTLARAFVGDYTIKAQWLVPPIQEILGPQKYQVVNEDIKDGLQSILTGGDKFANAQIKAKIFIQRLKEGQDRFLHDFLLPEVKAICDQMNFRTVPEIGFQPINLQDETVLARIYAQLGQLGILTAEQVVEAIDSNVLPDVDEMQSGQTEYKSQRDKGLYVPLVGGPQQQEGAPGGGGRPGGTSGIKQSGTRSSSPIGTSKGSVEAFSLKAYADCLRKSQDVYATVESAIRKRGVKGEFTEQQRNVVDTLVKHVVAAYSPDKWKIAAAKALDSPPQISVEIGRELDEIAVTYEVDGFDAAILRHCRTNAPSE